MGAMDENPYRAPKEKGIPHWVWIATWIALPAAWAVGHTLTVALFWSPWRGIVPLIGAVGAFLLVFWLFRRYNRPTRPPAD
jgi:uncharacterized membrane protein YdjX (TVP38/TMEM64 family)